MSPACVCYVIPARPAWISQRGVRLHPALLPANAGGRSGRLPAGRRHPLRRHHRLPAGRRPLRGVRRRPVRPLRPQANLHASTAVRRLRHLEYFHDHVRIEHLLFDGDREPTAAGALEPDRTRPGMWIELKESDAERYLVTRPASGGNLMAPALGRGGAVLRTRQRLRPPRHAPVCGGAEHPHVHEHPCEAHGDRGRQGPSMEASTRRRCSVATTAQFVLGEDLTGVVELRPRGRVGTLADLTLFAALPPTGCASARMTCVVAGDACRSRGVLCRPIFGAPNWGWWATRGIGSGRSAPEPVSAICALRQGLPGHRVEEPADG